MYSTFITTTRGTDTDPPVIRVRVYQNLTLPITTTAIPSVATNCVVIASCCSIESLKDLRRKLDRMHDFLVSPCAAHVRPTFKDYHETLDPSRSVTSMLFVSF